MNKLQISLALAVLLILLCWFQYSDNQADKQLRMDSAISHLDKETQKLIRDCAAKFKTNENVGVTFKKDVTQCRTKRGALIGEIL